VTVNIALVFMWLGVTAYAVLAGADFGAGFWDLFAGGDREGAPRRALIERVIGPVWEANHVWLIFVLVILWTAFPPVFAAVASSLYIPLTAVAIGIILRGAGFAFRKDVETLGLKRLFGVAFASSSIITPFFLGAVAGAIASGRVPLGNAAADVTGSWRHPTSLLGGALAVVACAFLAAVYLCHDAEARGVPELSEWFRVRALTAGGVASVLLVGGIAVLHADAPRLFDGLTGRALPVVIGSGVAGVAALLLTARRSYLIARVAAGLAVATVVWAWAVAQYPYMLPPAVRAADVSAPDSVLDAVIIALTIGAAIVGPSLVWLLALAQADHRSPDAEGMLGAE
jgi:cytochrome d ubiquinol oxidase subunit II